VTTALQGTLLGDGEPRIDRSRPFERVELDARSWVDVCRGWLTGADSLFATLVTSVPWRHRQRWMYDRMVDEPRLTCGYGVGELPHPVLGEIHAELSRHFDARFGGVFLNYYRDGHDSVAFHRDRELREIDGGIIAILTLGAVRPFLLRPRGGGHSVDVGPGSGDLLVMRGRCHSDWEHGVPKVASAGPRISVSLRVGMAGRADDPTSSHRRVSA
jgi:alkylated DNA repair dioxygenase AlkB